ncbi:hypothetical protein D7X33_13220 [Butyricicoccus sp. 1XD8-22]|nr:hypothetical protein D7X33_13220 [Butyricicoccus sp. 1XD8-22]
MPSAGGAKGLRPLDSRPSAGGAKGLRPLDSRPSAGGAKGLRPLDSRDFFGKKSSKNFITPAGGTGIWFVWARQHLCKWFFAGTCCHIGNTSLLFFVGFDCIQSYGYMHEKRNDILYDLQEKEKIVG